MVHFHYEEHWNKVLVWLVFCLRISLRKGLQNSMQCECKPHCELVWRVEDFLGLALKKIRLWGSDEELILRQKCSPPTARGETSRVRVSPCVPAPQPSLLLDIIDQALQNILKLSSKYKPVVLKYGQPKLDHIFAKLITGFHSQNDRFVCNARLLCIAVVAGQLKKKKLFLKTVFF